MQSDAFAMHSLYSSGCFAPFFALLGAPQYAMLLACGSATKIVCFYSDKGTTEDCSISSIMKSHTLTDPNRSEWIFDSDRGIGETLQYAHQRMQMQAEP